MNPELRIDVQPVAIDAFSVTSASMEHSSKTSNPTRLSNRFDKKRGVKMNRRTKTAGIVGTALIAGAIGTGVAAAGGTNRAAHASHTQSADKASAPARKHSPKHTGNHTGWARAAENEATTDDDGTDVAITDATALQKASAAALKYTGEGRVTETEEGDEDSYYEVEVTLDDGSQVDVQLDRQFKVVSSESDSDNS
jgi:uncharacterized membrane protein YkoI